MTGGQVQKMPLLRENEFLPDLGTIPAETAKKAKMIWINYPNNPTGATATPEFYRKLIAWAKAYEVAVVSDNAYSEVYFDNRPPVSFLEFPAPRKWGWNSTRFPNHTTAAAGESAWQWETRT